MDNLPYLVAGYGVSVTLLVAYALRLRRRLVRARRLAGDRAGEAKD